MLGLEREVALLIVSPDAAQVAQRVADLTAVAGFALIAGPTHEIHDLYFDAAGGLLGAQRLSLRVRTIDAERRVTLKGPARATPWGGVERVELEESWPLAGWFTLDVLRSIGFDVIQARDTQRRLRRLTRPGEPASVPLAELAVDAVIFHAGGRRVLLHEVELEVKGPDGAAAVADAVVWLRGQFGRALRPWPYSKLLTGRAIAALLADGALDRALGADGTLTPAAIGIIEAWLDIEDRYRVGDRF